MKYFKHTIVDSIIEQCLYGDERYRNATFIGTRVGSGHLEFMDDEHWKSGLLILGGARSGKTSRSITGMCSQLIRRPPPADLRERGHDGPLVIIDIRGDRALLNAIRWESKLAGRPFKLFATVPQFYSHVFNPLAQSNLSEMTLGQLAELLLVALNLWNGFFYGGTFFSSQSRGLLAETLRFITTKKETGKRSWRRRSDANESNCVVGDGAISFYELHKCVTDISGKKENEVYGGAPALVMMLGQLADMFHINLHTGRFNDLSASGRKKKVPESAIRSAIHLPDILFRDSHTSTYPVIYFFLRAQEAVTVSLLGKLALSILQNARIQHEDAHSLGYVDVRPPDIKVFIDEWHYLADDSVKTMLSQGGGHGLHFILSNQNIAQLEENQSTLARTVFENCGTKICYTARDPKLQNVLMEISGEKETWIDSHTFQSDGTKSITLSPCPRPMIERNQLVKMNAIAGRAYCLLPDNHGVSSGHYGHPFLIDVPHRFSKEQFEILSGHPMPGASPETIRPWDYLSDKPPYSYLNEKGRK